MPSRTPRRSGRARPEPVALTPEEAVRAHTIEAARAVLMDHLVGSLEPGKLADFAVLDGDPFSPAGGALRATGVRMTVQGGETVFQAGAADKTRPS